MRDDVYTNKNRCYGCGACAAVCPTDAIKMMKDPEGFLYPTIAHEKCVDCRKCVEQCIIEGEKQGSVVGVYACSAKDDDIIRNSTSGGVSYLLGECVLREGGVVYGASFSEDNKVEHIRVSRSSELPRIQGTKYVQSDITKVFKLIQKDVENNKHILFSGTPCQIAAVRRMFPLYTQLFCLEIVCMGCPSPGVWERYLQSKEKMVGGIERVRFRDKITGWRGSSISYFLQNKETKTFKSSMDEFMTGFGQCLFLRPVCHNCEYKGRNTLGDIKTGDFWGIENSKIQYNPKGVSVTIIETNRGLELFEKIKGSITSQKMDYSFAVSSNPCIEISKAPSKKRDTFFSSFQNKKVDMCSLIRENLMNAFQEEDRYICQYPVVDSLLRLVVKENGIKDYFNRCGLKKIAIYGMSNLGKLFIDILQKEEIEVKCIIDKNHSRFAKTYKGIPIIGPYQIGEYDYDCIIVTLVHLYSSVLETLMAQGIDLDKVMSLGSVV